MKNSSATFADKSPAEESAQASLEKKARKDSASNKAKETSSTSSMKASQLFEANNIARASKISDTQMLLNIEQGAFDPQETWFLRDDEGQEYVVIPQNILKKIVSIMRNAHEERLLLELARDISQNTPIDFDDVMAVARARLESRRLRDGSLPIINTKAMVKEIKKEYPNLFFDISSQLLFKGMR